MRAYERKKAEAMAAHATAYRLEEEAASLIGYEAMAETYRQLALQADQLAASYRSMASQE